MLGLTRRFSNASSRSGGVTTQGILNRLINWFRDLPSTPKLILVGIVLLLLLTVLSPLSLVAAALLFGVSIIALIIRRSQRESVKGWGIVAVASLIALFMFGGISNAIYGNGSSNNNPQSSGKAGGTSTIVEDQPAKEEPPKSPSQRRHEQEMEYWETSASRT